MKAVQETIAREQEAAKLQQKNVQKQKQLQG